MYHKISFANVTYENTVKNSCLCVQVIYGLVSWLEQITSGVVVFFKNLYAKLIIAALCVSNYVSLYTKQAAEIRRFNFFVVS